MAAILNNFECSPVPQCLGNLCLTLSGSQSFLPGTSKHKPSTIKWFPFLCCFSFSACDGAWGWSFSVGTEVTHLIFLSCLPLYVFYFTPATRVLTRVFKTKQLLAFGVVLLFQVNTSVHPPPHPSLHFLYTSLLVWKGVQRMSVVPGI